MFRQSARILSVGLWLTASAAFADPATDGVVSLLHQQGFSEIHISRTFLGRVRIVATTENAEREIVLNPRTGEVLRDFWTADDDHGNRRSALIELGAAAKSHDSEHSRDDSGGDNGAGDDNGGGDSGGDGDSGDGGDGDSGGDSGGDGDSGDGGDGDSGGGGGGDNSGDGHGDDGGDGRDD